MFVLVGFSYFGVNYVIEEIQNVLVGNINVDHDLLVVEFVEKEEGTLTLRNRIEINDEKHHLTLTYNVRVMDFIALEDSQLVLTTDSEQIEIVSYSAILLTTTNQAIGVTIALNEDYEFSPGEQLTFTLTFGLENYSPTIQEEPEPLYEQFEYTLLGSGVNLTQGIFTLENIAVRDGYLEFFPQSKSRILIQVDKGTLKIDFNLPSQQNRMEVLLNGVVVAVSSSSQQHSETIQITEENSTIIIRPTSSTGVHVVRQMTYTPE
jgi:hypothetical protein